MYHNVPDHIYEGYCEDYKQKLREKIKLKEAPRDAIIPNLVIREKLRPIIDDLVKIAEKRAITQTEKDARKSRFWAGKVYKHINQSVYDDRDGYYDADITDEKHTIQFIVRNVFDFGYYAYPKRKEGKGVFKRNEWTDEERAIEKWFEEFPPFSDNMRL